MGCADHQTHYPVITLILTEYLNNALSPAHAARLAELPAKGHNKAPAGLRILFCRC
jgi:hypothetical protein